jgi:hypothetical protein
MKIRICILLLMLGLTTSCFRKPDMNQPHVILADKFAHALAEGRFADAHSLFTEDQKKKQPEAELKKEYEEMISYGPGPATHIEVMQTLDVWPEKQKGDIGWVYVAIAGDNYSEAVAVVVARTSAGMAIRYIELGRP